jgi:REP element-mobilizing transposase RayT
VRESVLAPGSPGILSREPPSRENARVARYRAEECLPYFCTIRVLDWLPVLIEARCIDPIIDSLKFCREHKHLQLFAYVIMPNHMHLIAAAGERLQEVMRDFKRFTSRTIHDRLKADGRTTILFWLRHATQAARGARGELGLSHDGFHPQSIETPSVFEQKLRYLHENPVRKGLVRCPEDWWYGSAAWYAGCRDTCLEMDELEI